MMALLFLGPPLPILLLFAPQQQCFLTQLEGLLLKEYPASLLPVALSELPEQDRLQTKLPQKRRPFQEFLSCMLPEAERMRVQTL